MSTGTSSTFAKVDLILSLTTPYFANNLDLELGHPTGSVRLAFSWARCQKVASIDIE